MATSPTSASQPTSATSTHGVASYTSDELAFHKLFPQVPLNEKLVESYQCGLSRKKIVRMGRLYLTSLRLCFHSTFLSDNLMIEWEFVDAVEKKDNFVFEAIVVKASSGENHYFSAFMYGMTDQAHKMTTMMWNVRRKYAVGGGQGAAVTAAALQQGADRAGGGSQRTFHQRTESTASTGSMASPRLAGTTDSNTDKRQLLGAELLAPPDAVRSGPTSEVRDSDPLDGVGSNSGTPENTSMVQALGSTRNGSDNKPAKDDNGLATAGVATLSGKERTNSGTASPVVAPHVVNETFSEQPPTRQVTSVLTRDSPQQSPGLPPVTVLPPADPRPQSPTTTKQQPVFVVPQPTQPATSTTKADRRTEKAISRSSVVVDTPHDVLKYFPNVPKTETVVDSFQCSYVVGVHRLGKLYITANYVLFTSVMLADGVCLKFSDITSIEKEQTMVILDGVAIATKQGQTHAFTSFVNRDSAFSILQHFFAAHRSKATTRDKLKLEQAPIELATPVEATPLVDKMRGPLDPDSTIASMTSTTDSTFSTNKKKGSKKPKDASTNPAPVAASFLTSLVKPSYDALPAATSIDEFSKVSTDFTTGLSDVGKFLAKQIIPDVQFPAGVSIFDIFKAAVDDDTALLDAYHNQRQDKGMVWEPWRAPLAGSRTFSGQRKMTCTTIIRAVMAKECAFTEFQRFALLNVQGEPHLLLQFSGQAVGVMFSDSFRAETLLVFSQPSPTSPVVTLKTYGYIQFLRNVWVKSKILSTALDVEMPECYRTLSSMIVTKVKDAPRIGTVVVSSAADDDSDDGDAETQSPSSAVAPVVSVVSAAPIAISTVPPATVVSVTPAATHPTSPMLRQVHAGLYSLALLYIVKGLWATFWLDAEAAIITTSIPVVGGDVAATAQVPLQAIDLRWLVTMIRPVMMAAQLLFAVFLTKRIERCLS